MLISFIVTMTLLVILIVKVDLSSYLLDNKSAELLYSDSAYSDKEEIFEPVNKPLDQTAEGSTNDRYSSPTFTKEFDENSFTEDMASEEATRMLEKIYKGGKSGE